MAVNMRARADALLDREIGKLNDQIADLKKKVVVVKRLRKNADFAALIAGAEWIDDSLLPARPIREKGVSGKARVPRAKAAAKRRKPEKKSGHAEKRGNRADAICRVLSEAGHWLTAEEIRELLPTVGYTPTWSNPGANVRALIEEDRRKGLTRVVLREGKFGLPEWVETGPETVPKERPEAKQELPGIGQAEE